MTLTPDESRRDALFRELAVLRDLPPAPRTLDAIWHVLARETSSAAALADVLQRDTALTAKILRLVNSAYFALPRPVSEVRAACVALGFDTIRAMAVGVTALDAFARRVGRVIDREAFWRHSIAVATAAQNLVRRAGLGEPGMAFSAGVLHDVGKLVLATLSPKRYAALDVVRAGSAAAAEREEFGADHADVGGWLATRWHFPPEILEAIQGHHRPGPTAGRWGALVGLADGVAHRAGCGGSDDTAPPALDLALLEVVPVHPDALVAVEAGFLASLERVEAFAEAAGSA